MIDKIIYGVVVFIFVSMLINAFSTVTIPYQTNETYQEPVSLNYEILDQVKIVNKTVSLGFLELWRSKEAQVIIKNTDTIEGTFFVNFIFTTGKTMQTTTKSAKLLPGEAKTVTSEVPLDDSVKVEITVIPGVRYVEKTRTVTKEKPIIDTGFLSWFLILKKLA